MLFLLQTCLRRRKLVLKLANLSRAQYRMPNVMLALEFVDLESLLDGCRECLEKKRKLWFHVFLGVLNRIVQRHNLLDRLSTIRRRA